MILLFFTGFLFLQYGAFYIIHINNAKGDDIYEPYTIH